MIRVFVSSPYTGDIVKNLNLHFNMSNKLIDLGFAPFVPLLYHYLEISKVRDYDVWLNIDIEWLKQCNVVLRLPGVSKGADKEVEIAKKNKIPVFYDLWSLLEWRKNE